MERNRMQLCSCGICSILNSGLPYFFLDQTQFLKPSILLSMGSTHLNSETNARHSYIKPLNPGTILPMGAYWGGGGGEFSPPPRPQKNLVIKGKNKYREIDEQKKNLICQCLFKDKNLTQTSIVGPTSFQTNQYNL